MCGHCGVAATTYGFAIPRGACLCISYYHQTTLLPHMEISDPSIYIVNEGRTEVISGK
jgi:hypothetical protein